LTPENRRLAAAKELKRIARLAIPPAYRDVWISAEARGHLQATGRDARGRKQYRYHPDWRQVRDSAKFDRMFHSAKRCRNCGASSSAIWDCRAAAGKGAGGGGRHPGRDAGSNRKLRVCRDNKSFGLTTLRNRHVSFIRDGRAVLNFRGKGGCSTKCSSTTGESHKSYAAARKSRASTCFNT